MSISACRAPSAERLVRRRATVVLVCLVIVLGGCAGAGDADTDDAADRSEISTEPVGAGAPVPSAGCGAQDRTLATTVEGMLTSGGVARTYLLAVPSSNDGVTPMPLVLDLHGAMQTARWHDEQTAMAAKGEAEGFVTVTPQGIGALNALWVKRHGIDASYIDELLDVLEAGLCLDTSRFYVTGYSGGAMMTSLLSCFEADRFAAAAPVAAQLLVADCEPSRPVPVRAFQGTADPQPFDGGSFDGALAWVKAGVGAEPVDEALAAGKLDAIDRAMFAADGPGVIDVLTDWARRNGCAETFTEQPVTAHVRLLAWEACPADGSVELYVVEGGGHTWPGSAADAAFQAGGLTTMEIDATDLVWQFFARHRR